MNCTGKINAKKGPDEDYNVYRDFIDWEMEARIIVRWLVFAGMNDLESKVFIPF